MATTSGGAAVASSSPAWRKYDVFVSFRGKDTRKNFTDHLITALDRKRIIMFRDDRSLRKGKAISPELLKAIEESRFAIIVLSKNYADSSWCLDELLKIVECKEKLGQIIFPIFYGVNPSDVRGQRGSFLKAFDKNEKDFAAEKVRKWKTALTEVANLSGWHLQDRHESTFIQEIVKDISDELGHFFSVPKDLVGMDSRLQEMKSCLDMESDDVRFVGICGMGGVGKTTVARVIYDMFSFQFDGSSFVTNIRGTSGFCLVSLQEQLLSQILGERNVMIPNVYRGIDMTKRWLRDKRVLIILDDVDKVDQLETLAGEAEWFGRGSRIIITTRDAHLLGTHDVDAIYRVKSLNDKEALQLFSWKAFKENHPPAEYEETAKQIVNKATGLPLALRVLGSSLYGRRINEWISALKRLKESLNKDIFDILKLSYDSLEDLDKRIFLDISCFFNGKNVDRVIEILANCDFHPELGLNVLIEKSLISIDNHEVCVHSLLEEMARVIVYGESPKEPGKRSRLWLYSDIHHVLTSETGTEAVEVMYLNLFEPSDIYANAAAMLKMTNLRLLKIHYVHLDMGIDFLPSELRILKWNGYPLKSFPSSFKGEKLVELRMSHSNLEQLWKGAMHLAGLKVIKLSHSRKLTRILDFTGIPNLERLILEGCTSLCEVHPSIGSLEKLIILNLKDCRNLKSLPYRVSGWKSLKFLSLVGCTKIHRLPKNVGDFKCLEELDVGQTAITEVPSCIKHLDCLKKLSFKGCRGPEPSSWCRCLLPAVGQGLVTLSLPPVTGLWSLTQLDLSDCGLPEGAIPDDLGTLTALRDLNLSRNNFTSLPESINQLSNLENLRLEYCQRLQTLQELPSSIRKLWTHNCSSLEALASPLGLPMAVYRSFYLHNCFGLANNQRGNMVLSLLKSYLCSLAQLRLVSIFSNFPEMVENQSRSAMVEDHSRSPGDVPGVSIFICGCDIPDWFTYQTTHDTLVIELPPNWCDDHAFLGLAICLTFESQEHAENFGTERVYRFEICFYSVEDNNMICGGGVGYNRDTLDVCTHQQFLFLPFHEWFASTEYHVRKNWYNVKVTFRVDGPGLHFRNCGFRSVFMQDVELNENMLRGIDLSSLHDLITQYRDLGRPVIK